MNFWSFLFTKPSCPLESARVAADGRDQAHSVVAEYFDVHGLGPYEWDHTVIVSNIGRISIAEPRVVSIRGRDEARIA